MALADSQKISRVLSGKPFGDGRDGSLTISSNTTQTLTDESCSGSSGSTSLTTAGTTLSNDDIILIHQSRGTGAGNWEINKVASGGGTTSITLAENLANTYTDSGASQAQAIVIPMYTDITVNSSQTWNGKDWDGNVGGFLIAACNGTMTVNGALNHDGSTGDKHWGEGSASTGSDATGGGFYGGRPRVASNAAGGYGGEGTGGGVGIRTANAGNGAGAGYKNGDPTGASGGGGGNGTAGSNGTAGDTVGQGGSTAGSADLTTLALGGGGGGGVKVWNTYVGGGGSGAGGIVFFSKEFDISSGSASIDGGDGGVSGSTSRDGGGGAGGSMLVMGETIDMGSSVITASAGSGGSGAGNGGVGRIAVHYSGSVTGTTSPTLNSTEDSTLVELGHYPQIMTF